MKIFILSWNEYIIGSFSTKEKAEKAIDYYSKIEKFDDPRYDFDFEIKDFEIDKYAASNLNEIKEDGWFEIIDSPKKLKDKVISITIFLLIILIILLAIFGLITFLKIVF